MSLSRLQSKVPRRRTPVHRTPRQWQFLRWKVLNRFPLNKFSADSVARQLWISRKTVTQWRREYVKDKHGVWRQEFCIDRTGNLIQKCAPAEAMSVSTVRYPGPTRRFTRQMAVVAKRIAQRKPSQYKLRGNYWSAEKFAAHFERRFKPPRWSRSQMGRLLAKAGVTWDSTRRRSRRHHIRRKQGDGEKRAPRSATTLGRLREN